MHVVDDNRSLTQIKPDIVFVKLHYWKLSHKHLTFDMIKVCFVLVDSFPAFEHSQHFF